MSDISPLLDELDTLLSEISLDVDAMILGEVEGYIAGVIVLPKMLEQDQWMPQIWGGEASAFPDDPAKSERLVELVLARKLEVIGQFLTGGGNYDPVFSLDIDDTCLWEIWLEAFVTAIGLQEEAPDCWRNSDDEDLGTAALGMDLLIQIMNKEKLPKALVAEMKEMAPDLVGYYAETLYRRQRGLARVVLD